jgi:hypothetical protein
MFRKFACLFAMLFMIAGTAWAQNNTGEIAFNCDVVSALKSIIDSGDVVDVDLNDTIIGQNAAGDTISINDYISNSVVSLFSQDANTNINMNDIFAAANAACSPADANSTIQLGGVTTFSVIVSGNANLYTCADTSCDIVQAVTEGTPLTVVDVEGDWYQVQLADRTAYVASWFTTLGTDHVIQIDEPYLDENTGCTVAFNVQDGNMNIRIVIAGENRNMVFVDLYRPTEMQPLMIAGLLDKNFSDTGDPYIDQYYRDNVTWTDGMYLLEISLHNRTTKLGWELGTRGKYNILVHCP